MATDVGGDKVDPTALATTAAATVVGLLATDAWEMVRTAVGRLWQRVHPDRVDTVQAELAESRAEVLAARRSGDEQAEQELTSEWRRRLGRLLAADPEVAVELSRLLDDVLRPALAGARHQAVTMSAVATGQGRVYQAGRDQHITEH